jgi:glutathione synthase/RimK-type ligase-like ATP-grasp enzyme
MVRMVAICDYQNRFGSKYFDKPYRSGMDKQLLMNYFQEKGIMLDYLKLSDPLLLEKTAGAFVIYTSQEDPGYRYKSFIEDVVYALELNGSTLIPMYKFLRANNNKVFMEYLRRTLPVKYQNDSKWFGCAEEAIYTADHLSFPCVVKSSEGAGSHGVRLAHNKSEYVQTVRRLSRSSFYLKELRDIGRSFRHHGYKRESLHRDKFIVQSYIPGLVNDWKVLVYWDKFFVLRRKNRPGDFRASGSGLFSFDTEVDIRLLEAAKEVREVFNVPMISLDLAISEGELC